MNIKIRIDRKNKVEQVSLVFLLVMGITSNYIGLSTLWNVLLVVVFLSLVVFSKRFRSSLLSAKKYLVGVILITVFIIINILITNSGTTFLLDNLLKLYKTMIVASIIIIIAHQKDSILERQFISKFKLFNIVWVINLIVLSVQVAGYPLLIKVSKVASNTYYEDNCSGLFGPGGTHILAFFSIFIFIYNLYFNDYVKFSRRLQVFNYLTAIWMMILSTKNDNNAIFILYMMFATLYFYRKTQVSNDSSMAKLQKKLRYIIVFIIIAIVVIQIPSINNFLNDVFLKKFYEMLEISNTNLNGSTERLAIAYYALANGFGWKYGLGIGASAWINNSFYGFMHFGLSSIGSMIFLCGIWFYFLVSFFYTMLFANTQNKKRTGVIYNAITFSYLVIISIFTTIYTFALCMIWLAFIFTLLGAMDKRIEY